MVHHVYATMTKQAIEKFNPNVVFHTYPVMHETSQQEMDDLNKQFIVARLPRM